jgi:hypothetical protein
MEFTNEDHAFKIARKTGKPVPCFPEANGVIVVVMPNGFRHNLANEAFVVAFLESEEKKRNLPEKTQ